MFSDSNKFEFVDRDGEVCVVHSRMLGAKDGPLYGSGVSWADVVINGVPLDKTCQYEYEISIAHSIVSTNTDRGSIVINHRIGLNLVYPECNCDDFHLKN